MTLLEWAWLCFFMAGAVIGYCVGWLTRHEEAKARGY